MKAMMERAITAHKNEVDIFFRGVESLRLEGEKRLLSTYLQTECNHITMFT